MTELDPSSVLSEVWFGNESGKYTSVAKGVSSVYSQLYPFEGLLNYTSGIIHHVRLKGTSVLFILRISSCLSYIALILFVIVE